MDGARDPGRQNLLPGAARDPGKEKGLHMTFLPKYFRTQELVGLLAAIPAAALGSVFFLYLLDVANRLTV